MVPPAPAAGGRDRDGYLINPLRPTPEPRKAWTPEPIAKAKPNPDHGIDAFLAYMGMAPEPKPEPSPEPVLASADPEAEAPLSPVVVVEPVAAPAPALAVQTTLPSLDSIAFIPPEPPPAMNGRRPTGRQKGAMPTPEQAAALVAVWNASIPKGWNRLRVVDSRRWAVAQMHSDTLGGFRNFLAGLQTSLNNAATDRFWSADGFGWDAFMGYGPGSTKPHFLKFLEMEHTHVPTVNKDGSLTFAGRVKRDQIAAGLAR